MPRNVCTGVCAVGYWGCTGYRECVCTGYWGCPVVGTLGTGGVPGSVCNGVLGLHGGVCPGYRGCPGVGVMCYRGCMHEVLGFALVQAGQHAGGAQWCKEGGKCARGVGVQVGGKRARGVRVPGVPGEQSCTGLGVCEAQGAAAWMVPEVSPRRSPIEAGAAHPPWTRPCGPSGAVPGPRRALHNARCKGVCRASPPPAAASKVLVLLPAVGDAAGALRIGFPIGISAQEGKRGDASVRAHQLGRERRQCDLTCPLSLVAAVALPALGFLKGVAVGFGCP